MTAFAVRLRRRSAVCHLTTHLLRLDRRLIIRRVSAPRTPFFHGRAPGPWCALYSGRGEEEYHHRARLPFIRVLCYLIDTKSSADSPSSSASRRFSSWKSHSASSAAKRVRRDTPTRIRMVRSRPAATVPACRLVSPLTGSVLAELRNPTTVLCQSLNPRPRLCRRRNCLRT